METDIVFSMGDPVGIGPEVLLKSLGLLLKENASIRPTVVGAGGYLRELEKSLETRLDWDRIKLHSVTDFPFPPEWGRLSEQAGRVALASLRTAVETCRETGVPLLVTAPVNKEALHLAGFRHPGQTEFIGSFFPRSSATMAFLSDRLRVVLATVHLPLRMVFDSLDPFDLERRCLLFHEALVKLGFEAPRIAVSGLNPHASEGGLIGKEEREILVPVIARLNQHHGAVNFQGPFPPDTVFLRAIRGEFDGVVALYHDQGLIPLKLVAFEKAVNVSLGLPIVRTSPDHGTAFDIAGRGIADPGSMLAAIEWGLRLV